MRKEEKKLLKLQKKAQECVSRKKAVKILTKAEKWQKCLKPYPIENDSHYPQWGVCVLSFTSIRSRYALAR